jgi:hypothetical protein
MIAVLLSSAVLFAQTSWTGTTSTAWENAANWTAGVPNSGTAVNLGNASFTGANQPTITSSASAASITFYSTKATTLTIGGGGSLAVTGNVSGSWTVNRTHTLAIGAQSVSIGGSFTTASANNRVINTTISTGSLTITANLALNNNSTFTFSGAGNLYIGGNFTGAGTFTASTSTVTYNGSGAQTVAAKTYNNLTINKSAGTATQAGNTTVNNDFTISQGEHSTSTFTLGIAGNFTVNGTLSGSGAVTLSGTTKNINGTGSITNSATLTISGGGKTILSSANLTFSNTIAISGAITVTNNGIITSNANGGITGSVAGSTWTNAANSTLKVSGPLLATGTLNASANPNTVEYQGSSIAQTIKPVTYHNLALSNASTKTAATGFTVNNTLTIGSGSNLTINNGIILQVLGAVDTYGALTNNGQLKISN